MFLYINLCEISRWEDIHVIFIEKIVALLKKKIFFKFCSSSDAHISFINWFYTGDIS